jgi:indolepyruvate decarboxylase
VPAAIGAQLAAPELRPLVLVGDGAFQMTGLELSTVARYGLNPIVVVLNNGGYTTERLILDGGFNDILPWAYHRLPETLGAGRGYLVETEEDLDRALAAAEAETSTFSLLDVHLDRLDVSPALRRLGEQLNRTVANRG